MEGGYIDVHYCDILTYTERDERSSPFSGLFCKQDEHAADGVWRMWTQKRRMELRFKQSPPLGFDFLYVRQWALRLRNLKNVRSSNSPSSQAGFDINRSVNTKHDPSRQN